MTEPAGILQHQVPGHFQPAVDQELGILQAQAGKGVTAMQSDQAVGKHQLRAVTKIVAITHRGKLGQVPVRGQCENLGGRVGPDPEGALFSHVRIEQHADQGARRERGIGIDQAIRVESGDGAGRRSGQTAPGRGSQAAVVDDQFALGFAPLQVNGAGPAVAAGRAASAGHAPVSFDIAQIESIGLAIVEGDATAAASGSVT